ncbi:MAG: hypothetical protein ACOVMS_01315 [Flavobacterium sp.]
MFQDYLLTFSNVQISDPAPIMKATNMVAASLAAPANGIID